MRKANRYPSRHRKLTVVYIKILYYITKNLIVEAKQLL